MSISCQAVAVKQPSGRAAWASAASLLGESSPQGEHHEHHLSCKAVGAQLRASARASQSNLLAHSMHTMHIHASLCLMFYARPSCRKSFHMMNSQRRCRPTLTAEGSLSYLLVCVTERVEALPRSLPPEFTRIWLVVLFRNSCGHS